MRRYLIGFLFVLTALPLAAADLPPRTSALAGVTLKATPRSLSGAVWEFELAFDTHTQNLGDDVSKSAQLLAGGASYAALEWQGDPPGGHHRKGVLRFKPVSPLPQAIELRIQRAGEAAPRSFLWELR
jgi:hypothetical protein